LLGFIFNLNLTFKKILKEIYFLNFSIIPRI